MKKPNKWCKRLGHWYAPIYIVTVYEGRRIKYMAAYCRRCRHGKHEALDAASNFGDLKACTYSKKYWK